MFVIENYPTAVIFCVITMLCWGSWHNTQKLSIAGLSVAFPVGIGIALVLGVINNYIKVPSRVFLFGH